MPIKNFMLWTTSLFALAAVDHAAGWNLPIIGTLAGISAVLITLMFLFLFLVMLAWGAHLQVWYRNYRHGMAQMDDSQMKMVHSFVLKQPKSSWFKWTTWAHFLSCFCIGYIGMPIIASILLLITFFFAISKRNIGNALRKIGNESPVLP